MEAPAFGLFAFGPQAAGVGDTVSFDYFTLDGRTRPAGATAPAPATSSTGTALDTEKFNAIVRAGPAEGEGRGRQAEDDHRPR